MYNKFKWRTFLNIYIFSFQQKRRVVDLEPEDRRTVFAGRTSRWSHQLPVDRKWDGNKFWSAEPDGRHRNENPRFKNREFGRQESFGNFLPRWPPGRNFGICLSSGFPKSVLLIGFEKQPSRLVVQKLTGETEIKFQEIFFRFFPWMETECGYPLTV